MDPDTFLHIVRHPGIVPLLLKLLGTEYLSQHMQQPASTLTQGLLLGLPHLLGQQSDAKLESGMAKDPARLSRAACQGAAPSCCCVMDSCATSGLSSLMHASFNVDCRADVYAGDYEAAPAHGHATLTPPVEVRAHFISMYTHGPCQTIWSQCLPRLALCGIL